MDTTTTALMRQLRDALESLRTHGVNAVGAGTLSPAQMADAALAAADAWLAVSKTETPSAPDDNLIPPAVAAKQLHHCAIAVSDWLAGGCDVHDIPRPHIAALVTWTKETLPAPPAQEDKP